MFYLIDLLEEHGITYWLDFGSLLGAIRHKDIIPWDNDCDVGIFAKDKRKFLALAKRMYRDGFYLHHYAENMKMACFSPTNWNGVDVYFNWVVPASDHKLYWERPYPAGKTEEFHLKGYAPLLEEKIDKDTPIITQKIWGAQLDHTTDMPYWFVEELVDRKFAGRMMKCPRHPKWFLAFRYGPFWRTPFHWQSANYRWGGNVTPLTESLAYIERMLKRT